MMQWRSAEASPKCVCGKPARRWAPAAQAVQRSMAITMLQGRKI